MLKDEILLTKLLDNVTKYDKFVLYGAGYMAKELLRLLKTTRCYPSYCVVTTLDNDSKAIDDIPVYELNDKVLELKTKNILVIVATTSLYEKDIKDNLYSNNILNVTLISDYILMPLYKKTFEGIYKDKDICWFVSRIKNWYFEENGIELDFLKTDQVTERDSKKIVIVVENFAPRVLKIARALKDKGRDVVVLLDRKVKEYAGKKFCSSLLQINIKHYFYTKIEELMFLILQNKGAIIHIFTNAGNMYSAYILIKFQCYIGKVVFENYDLINGFYTNFDDDILMLERYCLENAAGVCYREYSLSFLTDILGIHIQGKIIRFWDYCSDRIYTYIDKNEDRELSLCYAGGVITEEEYPDCPFGGFLQFGEQCEKNKCHLHIYPSVWDEKRYKAYIQKDKESIYFHFHRTVDYDELIYEISQYDYGITLTKDNIWEQEKSGYNTRYKYIYAGANKYFDYLDAGIPIIAGLPLKMIRYLEEKDVLINWTNGQYDFEYLKRNLKEMRHNVRQIKQELRIGNHINELLDFYDAL